jgi:CHAT domain-containing protein/tetratricopeptide (TPR) repeat protein
VLQLGFQYPGDKTEQAVAAQLDVDADGNGFVRIFVAEGQSGKARREVGIRGSVDGTWRLEVRYGHARLLINDALVLETVVYSGETGPSTAVVGCLHGTVHLSDLLMNRVSVRQPLTSAEQKQVRDATALTGKAELAYVQGDYPTAIAIEEQALSTYKEILGDRSFSVGAAQASFGTFLNHTTDLPRARSLLEDAVQTLRQSAGPDHPQTAAAELSLANSLTSTRDLTRALPLAQHSLEVAQRVYGEDDPVVAAPLSTVSAIDVELGQFDEAVSALRQAVKIRTDRFGNDNIHIAPYVQQLAELELSAKDFDHAITDFETVRRIYSSQGGSDADGRIRATRNLAHAYGRLGKADKMRSTLRDALTESVAAFSGNDYRVGLLESDLATLELLDGHPEDANSHARNALRIQLSVTLNAVLALSEHEALLAVVTLEKDRDLFASTLIDEKANISRGDYALLAAARGLVTQVYLARLESAREASPKQQSKIRQQLSNVRSFLSGFVLYNGRVRNDSRITSLVDMLTGEQERLERQLYATLPNIAGRLGSEKYIDELLKRRINEPGRIIVDFVALRKIDVRSSSLAAVRHETSYDVFVIGGPDTDTVTHLKLGTTELLDKEINRWLDDVRARRYNLEESKSSEKDAAFKVRDLVWAPIQKAFPDVKSVTVVPDGMIAKLPWSALPAFDGVHYLVEAGVGFRTGVSVANSLAPEGNIFKPLNQRVVLIGNVDYDKRIDPANGRLETDPLDPPQVQWPPLPGTALELQKISELARKVLGPRLVTVLSGPNATEDAVEKALVKAQIAHFATHGYFSDETPLTSQSQSLQATSDDGGWHLYAESLAERSVRSPSMRNGLVLSGVNLGSKIDGQHLRMEKGILTAHDISDLDLRGVELAVLSACDSGLGTIESGEGVFGLQRSLLMVGVRRVLASLWRVGDATTAEFMVEFYEALLKSRKSPEDALKEVQLNWIKARRVAATAQRGPGPQTPVDPEAMANATVMTPEKQRGAPADWAAFQLMK